MALDHAQYEDLVNQYFNQQPQSSYETVYCPICEAFEEYLFLFQKGLQKIVRCKCGFVYSKRQPKAKVLEEFYQKSNAMKLWSEIKDTQEQKEKQRDKFSRAIDVIKDLKPHSILDVGCGNGEFLSLLPDSMTCNTTGLEPNEDAFESAKKKGLTVFKGTLDSLVEERSFDLITLWGVLEHVKDPKNFLQIVRRHLNPRGKVLICVPNVESQIVELTWGGCFTFCPQHLWYFSSDTLLALLQWSGFRLLSWWTIESEVIPILKAESGLEPYDHTNYWDGLPWRDPEKLKKREAEILSQYKGYKIVMVVQKT